MPIFLILIALYMFIIAIMGNEKQVGTMALQDVSGFFYFIVVVLILYIIGMNKSIAPISRAMLWLIVIAYVISQRTHLFGTQGVASQIKTGLSGSTVAANTAQGATTGILGGIGSFLK